MKRRAFVFYISQRPGRNRQWISLPGGGRAFVRVVAARPEATVDEALDEAEAPMATESLMNTHELKVD